MSEGGGILRAGAIAARIAGALERDTAGQSYGSAGVELKKALAEARASLLKHYARGDVIVEKLAAVTDEAIGALARPVIAALPAKAKVAIAATGGYGRGQLAPCSDIDLLILHSGVAEPPLGSLSNSILHPLWNAGLAVGHGVHTPASAAKLAAQDMTPMTAYLDARPIVGDAKLFKDFAGRMELLRWRMKSTFVAQKRAEQEARHEASNQSRYLAEPDLKEGKGGLRDIHVIGWIYHALYGKRLGSARKRAAIFRPAEVDRLRKCERFLLSLRVHLHDLRGRADERLSFDIQPALAERLGYADRAGMSAAERMMKHYFVNAMEIGRLTRIFGARIEEENAKLLDRAPLLLPKALASDEAGRKINLRLKNGRLDFASARNAARNPADPFRYFRAFAKRPDLDFHPDALDVISRSAAVVTSEVRRNPVIAQLFVASLAGAKDPMKLLRVMSETGLLGKYIPFFGQITGRVEYGLYRRYSLEEHVFQSIGVLSGIRSGALAADHPIATAILKRREPAPFYLAVLLHQAGASLKAESIESAEALIGRVSRRLGLLEDHVRQVAWCAARPHLMAGVAQRRNLGEPRSIADFAAAVGTAERLELLLVLTICHLRTVSDDAWDDWTKKQITALYQGASAFLAGGDAALNDFMGERAERSRNEAEQALDSWPKVERARFLKRLSDEILSLVDPETFARAAALARGDENEGVALTPYEGDVEAIVYARDRAGVLADLAGAIAGAGGNVRTVHALTLDDGEIIDVFTVRPPEGAIPNEFAAALHQPLLDAARGGHPAPRLARRIGDRRALFSVPPVVRIDDSASDSALVVEAEGRDRTGLLYNLCSELTDLGLVIRSAHIATYGERAVDAFYLQTNEGKKVEDEALKEAIKRRLLSVLAEPSPSKGSV